MSTNPALTDPAAAQKLTDEEWVALHVPRFKAVRLRYRAFARFLESILKAAVKKLAPMAIVNTRPKEIASFAEKILRKRALYTDPKDPLPPDPLARMTDLCGGRVITHTSAEVEKVCAFIKAAFDIDWPNSEDVSRRLRPTEFGYRSFHYIVSVNEKKLREAGFSQRVPAAVHGLKAEVQVRTLLEHASADIGHDTLYKAGMRVPEPIQRQFAAVAAVLEGSDREFGRLLNELRDLRSHQGAWHTPDEVRHELDRLGIVLQCEPHNEELAIRIGELALSIGAHAEALSVLAPFRHSHNPGVERVRGIVLTEIHWGNPESEEFGEGLRSLEAACEHSTVDAETLCALAEAHARRGDNLSAGNCFQKAILADHTEPLCVSRFLEFEVARQQTEAPVHLAKPVILQAMDRCRREIAAGVNLPVAWSSLAVFQLLTEAPFAALHSLAKVITLCVHPTASGGPSPQPCAAGRALLRTRETVQHLAVIREKLAGFDWFERLLLLALAGHMNDADALAELQRKASWKEGRPHLGEADSVVIISGGCSPAVQPAINTLRPRLRRAFDGLTLTLLAGGTRMGISGLAGEMAARSKGRLRVFGYVPGSLPVGVTADKQRMAGLFETTGTDFTPLEPLQGWTDLIAAGVAPARVKLLSYAGGDISKVEYAVALALGAKVGFIECDAVPAERRAVEPLWQDQAGLVRLPLDAMTIRAFLQIDDLPLAPAALAGLEKAARMAHEDYMRFATPRDDALQPWESLADSLKQSNYHQVAYWEKVLLDHSLGVRPLSRRQSRGRPLSMTQLVGSQGIRRLAEIEHGRWNVERLSLGWRYAEKKDIPQKRSPWLIPWRDIPKHIRKFDLDAIVNLPKKLREAGLELYRL
ncbi:MAG: RyR domain-containing protein [Verrucomicrobiota bacterium]|jgi:ppGpp synthetase/RelA/SpoT-type nucleotidyltranferase